MMYRIKCLLVLSVVACSAVTGLKAQDDLEALLQDLGGKPAKKPEAVVPAPEPAPIIEEKKAELVPEPAPVIEEKKAEPAPAPVVEEKKAEPAPEPVVEEKKADEPAPAPAPAAELAPAADPAPDPAADPAADPAPAAALAVTKPPASDDQAALISELMTLEKIRRQSLDNHGLNSLDMAKKAFAEKDYVTAREQYTQALDFIVSRPATVASIAEARDGIRESYYQRALQAFKRKDYEAALPLASKAKELGHAKAQRLIDELSTDPAAKDVDVSEISHRINEKDYKADQIVISNRLRRSRQFFTTGEYDKAQEECDLVLRDYPENVDAMQMRIMIADRTHNVADLEFQATRDLMIRDVRRTWTPDRYAIDSSQLPNGKSQLTSTSTVDPISGSKSAEQVIAKKLRDIVIPEVTFRPPATIIDAVDFFKQSSRDYDDPEIPVEARGVNLVLKLASTGAPAQKAAASDDPFAASSASAGGGEGVPVIPAMSARFINLYDALKLVCDVTGMKFRIRGNIVMIVPLNDPDDELISRSYNVVASFQDRITSATSEMGSGKKTGDDTFMQTADMGETQDWKAFFKEMGVDWPDGSSISYMATIGKLRVKNTEEQLATFEQVLEDMNVTPRLIEIEARFVEVNQNDLNSLGFEWLLNSDFSFDSGILGNVLDAQNHSNKKIPVYDPTGTFPLTDKMGAPLMQYAPYMSPGSLGQGYYVDGMGNTQTVPLNGVPGSMPAYNHNASVNAVDGNTFSTGNRYLSTDSNPIAGQGNSINDQFMQVNAFLGNADVSMILHMLSQRSDSDLLSAPKVVTKSGQEAIMKVVTEYIYPTEFQVTSMQSSGTGSGGTSVATIVPTPFMVEPQNFEMREVGVILQVVPEVSAEGQMINLLLNPQVVSEPVWKNYGTQIPTQVAGPTIWNSVLGIFQQTQATEYIQLPMEQPFFPVRSVSTQLSIYNGATVVMGGLINEQRLTMEDKVPFLGDLPFIGRLFRSRSEKSDKRNLLVFVTARLVDPAGRVVKMSGEGESAMMSGTSALTPANMAGKAAIDK